MKIKKKKKAQKCIFLQKCIDFCESERILDPKVETYFLLVIGARARTT